jgi:L-alanine-DL-glutamate epimerase-like enolase superfamily enzyme
MSRIAGVSTFLLTAPGRHVGMPDTQRSAALIQITTDDGATGLGETYAGLYVAPVVPSLVEVYRPLLLGSDPDEIGPLLDTMRLRSMRWGMVGLPVQVMSGIEMALWDLYAKRRDVPAYRVLGRMAQPRLRLYASAYAAPHPPQATAAKVAHYAAAGFTAVKLATGFWDHPRDASTPLARIIEEERAKLDAIRREVGGGVDIALDHHGANNPHPWSGETAAEIIGALDDYGLMWIEQPCASHDVAGTRGCAPRCARRSPAPKTRRRYTRSHVTSTRARSMSSSPTWHGWASPPRARHLRWHARTGSVRRSTSPAPRSRARRTTTSR